MKQYIRTKNGIIKVLINCFNPAIKENLIKFLKEQDDYIIKEADTIEDLIMVGDLVKISFRVDNDTETFIIKDEQHLKNIVSDIRWQDIYLEELHTKQSDNYALAWTKKEE